ncbi:Transferase [Corchorus olitorius]|uniref:Transferase n=1 Tax=Corchorus olitorius TaxID=93759 RepID=A0A1R3IFP0_9ROSI|nr:Transferase [Corchorus olitorius]
MKKIEVEVVSKEIVQPSSPTPDHLRSYQLSFLDQFSPSVYNPLVLFYPELCDTEANKIKISDQLKQSLSEALTYFYPLAGRITSDKLFVDCNGEGIPFLEARVKCQLSDVINNPVPSELTKLLPFHIHNVEEFPMGVQLNIFECGGIGVGVCTTHKIVDALSFMRFVNLWAAIARGDKNLIAPQFGSAEIFPPPKEIAGFNANTNRPALIAPKENIITKRFVFSASKIGEIREKYSDKTSLENPTRPTRIEALSAFMWNRFADATKVSPDTLCTIIHLINLRTRTEPPLPEHAVGNLYTFAMTVPSMDKIGESCHYLITEMRESIKKIDREFVRRIQDGYSPSNYAMEILASHGAKRERLTFTFTSLCRFPRYEADFGWGKPVWASSVARDMKNVVSFMDTATGNGVEAWVSLKEEDMAKLESDDEFLAYISPKNF